MVFDDSPPSTLRDYIEVLRRRKWTILQAVVLVPVVAVLWSSQQPAVYQASSNVLVNTQNVAANLSGISDPTQTNATRVLTTQVELARVPEVAQRAVSSAGVTGWSGSDLLGASTVTSKLDSDVMTFTVQAGEPGDAVRLVNEYARQFTLYRLQLDTEALKAAIESVEMRMDRLEEAGRQDSALYASMADRRDSLDTLSTLQTARATVIKEASGATQVEPNPESAGLLGLALGIVLGLGLAFVRETLDTRVRTVRAILERLRMPLLGRLPKPPRALRRSAGLVTLDDPHGPQAEAFRILVSNLDLVNLELGAKSIMLTSAFEQEGKSTTAANLAVAFARAGKRVTLIDFDFRNPWIHRFFDLERAPGLSDAATGKVDLYTAFTTVDIWTDGPNDAPGTLRVLPAGAPVSEPAWIVGSPFGSILEQVRHESDVVLVDAPPLLLTGDALEASSRIDAMLLVTRLNHVRRPMLDELERTLRQSPATKLGFVVTDAETEVGYGYLARPYHRQTSPA